ncbi:TetR/AcrR family transcriptional regulator [Phreatobacter sp. AB_2022a]|uniref:TetR/AcrR family transcriptional regulator n=1 Tax=Phreatobacter sp. AB_2022a TaxID=3003134 RepID=UPI0022871F8E|nr:TetR/AcrR family transcriptional regulator [Phreatobacter sp. AB_2022a]MCZ0733162.1 TetR/AcrR family transcriptional regulator [Phreatobacter sp. AB_2022a]
MVSVRAGRPRDQAVNRAILDAARDLIAEQGYGSFSIEAVAARASVAKQSIYRRWASRGALLIDVYMDGLESARPLPGTGFGPDFKALMSQTVERQRAGAYANVLKGLMIEAQSDADLRALFIAKIVAPRRETLRRVLVQGKETGELPDGLDVEMMLDMTFGAVWFYMIATTEGIQSDFPERALSVFETLMAARAGR